MKLVPLQKKGHKIVKKKKGQKDAVKHKKLLMVPINNTTHLYWENFYFIQLWSTSSSNNC